MIEISACGGDQVNQSAVSISTHKERWTRFSRDFRTWNPSVSPVTRRDGTAYRLGRFGPEADRHNYDVILSLLLDACAVRTLLREGYDEPAVLGLDSPHIMAE